MSSFLQPLLTVPTFNAASDVIQGGPLVHSRYLQDYYFISTSSPGNLHNLEGGYCKTHNMKVVFKVPSYTQEAACLCYSNSLQVSQNVMNARSEPLGNEQRGESMAGSNIGSKGPVEEPIGERVWLASSISSRIDSTPILLILSFIFNI